MNEQNKKAKEKGDGEDEEEMESDGTEQFLSRKTRKQRQADSV